jgi:hypothetical protein
MEQLFTAIRAHVLQASHRAIRYIFFCKAQAPHKKRIPLLSLVQLIPIAFFFSPTKNKYGMVNAYTTLNKFNKAVLQLY